MKNCSIAHEELGALQHARRQDNLKMENLKLENDKLMKDNGQLKRLLLEQEEIIRKYELENLKNQNKNKEKNYQKIHEQFSIW